MKLFVRLGCCGALTAALAACTASTTQQGSDEPEAEPQSEQTPLEPKEASAKEIGEQLEASVPLLSGGALELASLRGRPLAIVLTATWVEDFDARLATFVELARARGEQAHFLFVVSDEVDSMSSVLDPMVEDAVRVGLDPMGALSAKLQIATFPTFLLVDAEGRVAWQAKGGDLASTDPSMGDQLDLHLGGTN